MLFTRFVIAICTFTLFSSLAAGAQPASTSHYGYAPVLGGKLYYEIAGSGQPVVFIHGGQLDRRLWDNQFSAFARDYQVIRYDVRGFGKSPAASQPYADEEDLYALLKYLKIEKAFLVGLSLGGRIVTDFALAHPNMVTALIPVAPGLSGFHFSSDPTDQEIFEAAQAGEWSEAAEAWLRSGYMKPAMENAAIAPRIRQLSIENAQAEMQNPLLLKTLKPPAIDRLEEIHVPTLIIVGNRDVQDIHQIVGLMACRIRGAKLLVISGSGHMVSMEKPNEFNQALTDFFKSLR